MVTLDVTEQNKQFAKQQIEAFKKIDVMITNKINKFIHLEKFRNLIFCIFEKSSNKITSSGSLRNLCILFVAFN